MWIFLVGAKDQATNTIQRFQAAAESESGKRLKTLRTDRGWEFNSLKFGAYCAEHSVQRQLSTRPNKTGS